RIDPAVREADPAALANLPEGLDGARYRWVDLDGEGVSGILSEQGGAWWYKRNLSPVPVERPDGRLEVTARFAPVESLASQPAAGLAGGARLLDLAGDGRLDLAALSGPAPGFYERT